MYIVILLISHGWLLYIQCYTLPPGWLLYNTSYMHQHPLCTNDGCTTFPIITSIAISCHYRPLYRLPMDGRCNTLCIWYQRLVRSRQRRCLMPWPPYDGESYDENLTLQFPRSRPLDDGAYHRYQRPTTDKWRPQSPPNTCWEQSLYDLTVNWWHRFDSTAKVTLRKVFADEEGELIHRVCRHFWPWRLDFRPQVSYIEIIRRASSKWLCTLLGWSIMTIKT